MKRLLAPLVATAVLAALVLAVLDLGLHDLGAGVRERLSALAPLPLVGAFAVYGAVYLGRAVRLAVLLPEASGLLHLASVSARHNLLNLVLPFRSGELALPWMLRSEAARPLAEGAAALIVCRVLDLFCVFAYAALGLAWAGTPWSPDAAAADAFAARSRIVPVLLGLALALLLLRPLAGLLARRVPPGRGRALDFAARAAGHLAALGHRRLLAAVLTSLGTWFLTYLTFWLLLLSMSGPDPIGRELGEVGFARSLAGSTGLHLSTVLPVNTFGAVGSWELGWIAGYVLLAGVGRQAAGISAVVTHLAVFVFIGLLGGLAFAVRRHLLPATATAAPPAA